MPYKPHLIAWSYSRYSVHHTCPFKAKCQFVDKLPTPASPQMEAGNKTHKAFEDYLLGKRKTVPSKYSFMRSTIDQYKKHKAEAEKEVAFDRLWQPTGWFDKNTWVRSKTDVGFFKDYNYRITVDYKTGKEYDNHREQADLYALIDFHLYQTKYIDVEFIYVDIPKLVRYEYDIEEYPMLLKIWDERGEKVTKDRSFKPKPGIHCNWCAFSKAKGGPCKY